MTDTLANVNPAAVQRQIQALTSELLTLTTSKATARTKPGVAPPLQTATATPTAKPAATRRAS